MITGATHTLSIDLVKSLQDFRSIIDQRLQAAENKKSTPHADTTPIEKKHKPEGIQEKAVDYEALNVDLQTRRNMAWQEAIHTAKLQHKQNLDTNINVFSVEHNSRISDIDTADFRTRRSNALQVNLDTTELQHPLPPDNPYVNIRLDDQINSTPNIETQDSSQISLKYSRRLDLINAFESVANGESNGSYIRVIV